VQPRAAGLARSRGITIVGTDFDDLRSLDSTYDAVVAFDVIEHVHDPLDFLSRLAAVVKPGGQIVVGTGNSDSWSSRLMGSRYWYCAPAEHISFVNPRWCTWAASRANLFLEGVATFSHMPASGATKMSEIMKNLIYRVSPAFFGKLRRLGFGHLDAERFPALAGHPPGWGSSVDHFLAYFAKPG
jgi:SAM-dependent methyltransferase